MGQNEFRLLWADCGLQSDESIESSRNRLSTEFDVDQLPLGEIAANRLTDSYDAVLFVSPDETTLPQGLTDLADQLPVVIVLGKSTKHCQLKLLDTGVQDCLSVEDLVTADLSRLVEQAVIRHRRVARLIRESISNHTHDFVDRLAHDFRGPLTVIKEYGSLVRDQVFGDINDQQRRMLDIVDDRTDDLNTLVENRLDAIRLVSGSQGAWRRNEQVEDVIQPIQRSLNRKSLIKEVPTEWCLAEDLPTMLCDSQQIGRVITNLFINALASSEGDSKITISSALSADQKDVLLTIRQQGVHFDDYQLQRFQRILLDARFLPHESANRHELRLHVANQLAVLNLGKVELHQLSSAELELAIHVPVLDPVELTRRYLDPNIQSRLGRNEFDALSFVLITVEQESADQLKGIDALLNYCLGADDLLLPLATGAWAIVLPLPANRIEERLQIMQQVWRESNENRPTSPLPEIQSQYRITWNPNDDPASAIAEIREMASLGQLETCTV